MLQGTLFTEQLADGAYYSSYKEKFIIMDNLNEKGDPVIKAKPEIYNTYYTYVTIVTRGTLHIRIGGTLLDVKANEYLVVMPCMSIEVLESHCMYCSFLTQNHIVNDIYEHSGLGSNISVRSFTFHHIRMTETDTDILVQSYFKIKREHMRPDSSFKLASLRALYCAYLVRLHELKKTADDEINHHPDTRQRIFFDKFLEFLSVYCKQERSVQFYADKLRITPKYLSNITNMFAGTSSSTVIDQYVIYSIKQALYTNDHNIKRISEIYHFPSQSFFGRYFKRITGMSPKSYVKYLNQE